MTFATLTPAGRALLGSSVLGFALGALLGEPLVVAVAATALGLTGASGLAARQRAEGLRALRVEAGTPAGPTHARGAPVPLELTLVNSTRRPQPLLQVTVRVAGEPSPEMSLVVDAPPAAETRVRLESTFPAAGRWVIHGVDLAFDGPLGLTRGGHFLPGLVTLHIRPRRLPRGALRDFLPTQGSFHDRAGPRRQRAVGSGLEIRELRDYRAGDSLRTIAWKATARRNQPVVRVFEEESIRRLQILVHLGLSMRTGEAGETPLDRTLDMVTTLIESFPDDRVGVTTFDHRVFGHLPPDLGRPHVQRVIRFLISVGSPVDADLTELSNGELIARVGAFLAEQGEPLPGGGLDARLRALSRGGAAAALADPLGELFDVGAVFAAATRRLEQLDAEEPTWRVALSASRVREAGTLGRGEPLAERLRRFCAAFGVPLPARLTASPGGADRGLDQALRLSLGPKAPSRLIIAMDPAELSVDGRALRTLRLARLHKQEVVVVDCGAREPSEAIRHALRLVGARLWNLPGEERAARVARKTELKTSGDGDELRQDRPGVHLAGA